MKRTELVAVLTAQHRELQKGLALSLVNSKTNTDSSLKDVLSNLAQFRKDLEEHIKLENDEFYPSYFHISDGNEKQIAYGKEFIEKMIAIGKHVFEFLDRFDTQEGSERPLIPSETSLFPLRIS